MISGPVIHLFNDLITINKNRVVGSREILHELEGEEILKAHCHLMIDQSERNIKELSNHIVDAGAEVEDKTATSGFIYNTWMNIAYDEEKESAEDLHNYLKRMEETTLKGYEALLKNVESAGGESYDLVVRQRKEIADSLQKLMTLLK
jgi:uncharacterized protein (TIGR02284 family)